MVGPTAFRIHSRFHKIKPFINCNGLLKGGYFREVDFFFSPLEEKSLKIISWSKFKL